MDGLIKMRKVNQLGFLVVNKNKPKPKRYIQDINLNTFLDRVKKFKYIGFMKTSDKEEVFVNLKGFYGVHGTMDYQLVGNIIRVYLDQPNKNTLTKQWTLDEIAFGSYQRAKESWLLLFDFSENRTYVFVNHKPYPETELEIWEMSDLNYWG